jgi:hypothetical protein
MDLQRLEDMFRELLQAIQAVVDSEEEIPDDLQGALAQTLGLLYEKIEASRAAPLPTAPEIPQSEYPSSNVNGLKYDPNTQKLYVQFHGPYPQAEGSIYSYDNVPPFLVDLLESGKIGPKTSGKNKYHQWVKGVTPSLGGALNALLKAGGFAYQKLS